MVQTIEIDVVDAAVTLLTDRVRITRESALGILTDTARCQRTSLTRYAAHLVAAHEAAIATRTLKSGVEAHRFEPSGAIALA